MDDNLLDNYKAIADSRDWSTATMAEHIESLEDSATLAAEYRAKFAAADSAPVKRSASKPKSTAVED